MTTIMKDLLVVDDDDTEEPKLIKKQYRCCLAAAMQSYKKQLSGSQGPDDTSFESCVTMLAKLLRCHGSDEGACRRRELGPPPYIYNEGTDPAARLRIVS
jgi:hypothetical protein